MESISVKRFIAKDFHTVEAFKTLRTNIIFSGSDVRSIALTSVHASEGKSTLSFQLAVSLAQMDKKVLLLDADLRKSVLAKRLHVRGVVEGLTHALSGMSSFNDVLTATDIPGLYIIFAGGRIPNAAEVLGSKNFANLLKALRESFDYVIVDAAPLGQIVDCAVIAPLVDGVLMVIDSMNNSYKLERRVKAQLERSGGRVLGAVLNRVDFSDRSGYYGKAYDYSYGYGEDKQK